MWLRRVSARSTGALSRDISMASAFDYRRGARRLVPTNHCRPGATRMLRSTLAFGLLLISSLGAAALSQFAKDPQQPTALDPEYRKLDALVSFLRARNAEQFTIRSP